MPESFSEADLLAKIFPLIKSNSEILVPPGDDCAVFKSSDKNFAVTVDQLIESKHYKMETDPGLAGKKLMARNLSDIAAMGGTPKFAVMTSASASKDEEWLLEFHKGVIEEGDKYKVTVIGGDLAATRLDTVSTLTLIGEVEETGILRSGAEAGMALYVTGDLGASFESEHHLTFTPRVDEGKFLKKYAEAMIDITDGLLIDLKRICLASKCSAELALEELPLRQHSDNSLRKALIDGEDYELLFAVKEENVKSLQKNWPFSTILTMIGRFIEKKDAVITSTQGQDLLLEFGEGFDHFK